MIAFLTIAYKFILAFFIFFNIWQMFRTKNIFEQLCGAILVIPFFFRLLGLK